jgi:hypothetical protein
MTTRPRPDIPVTSDTELTERLRALLELDGPPVRRSLFLAWLRPDGTMVPLVIPVEDVPVEPDRVAIGNIIELHTVVAESEGVDASELHLAMLLERRGPAALSADDHAWHSAIEAIVRGRDGLDCSMHVGNGRTVVAVLSRQTWPST